MFNKTEVSSSVQARKIRFVLRISGMLKKEYGFDCFKLYENMFH